MLEMRSTTAASVYRVIGYCDGTIQCDWIVSALTPADARDRAEQSYDRGVFGVTFGDRLPIVDEFQVVSEIVDDTELDLLPECAYCGTTGHCAFECPEQPD
jgi:hypothetical protein